MKTTLKLAITTALLGGLSLASSANATDKDLLDTLLQNGAINQAQYEKLVAQVEEKERAAAESAAAPASSAKEDDWASRVKFSGDVRVRQEFRDYDSNTPGAGVKSDRQRYRARLAADAKINDEVDAGIRLATGDNEDPTSTNGDMNNGFSKKDIWLDLAFVDWHPDFAPGGHLIAGKMKQPWYKVADLIWDDDVNPEGVELKYTTDISGVKLTAQGGYFIVQDGAKYNPVDGSNDSYNSDMNLYHGGLSAEMKFTDKIKASLGYNAFIYNNTRADLGDKNISRAAVVDSADGSTINITKDVEHTGLTYGSGFSNYHIHEIASAVDIDTGYLPIRFYAQYAINAAAVRNPVNGKVDDQDEAWLAGISTKYNAFTFNYNYRDTQRDAVLGTFNDAEFCQGYENCRGHAIRLNYDISKNFYVGGAYFLGTEYNGDDRNVAQIDLGAKF